MGYASKTVVLQRRRRILGLIVLSGVARSVWVMSSLCDPPVAHPVLVALTALDADLQKLAEGRALRAGDLPDSGGAPTQLTVTVPLATLQRHLDAGAAALDFLPLSAEAARRLAPHPRGSTRTANHAATSATAGPPAVTLSDRGDMHRRIGTATAAVQEDCRRPER